MAIHGRSDGPLTIERARQQTNSTPPRRGHWTKRWAGLTPAPARGPCAKDPAPVRTLRKTSWKTCWGGLRTRRDRHTGKVNVSHRGLSITRHNALSRETEAGAPGGPCQAYPEGRPEIINEPEHESREALHAGLWHVRLAMLPGWHGLVDPRPTAPLGQCAPTVMTHSQNRTPVWHAIWRWTHGGARRWRDSGWRHFMCWRAWAPRLVPAHLAAASVGSTTTRFIAAWPPHRTL